MSSIVHRAPAGSHVPEALRAVGRAVGYALVALGHIPQARAAVSEYETLSGLDDGRLAERGLRREDIARHVFLRHFPDV